MTLETLRLCYLLTSKTKTQWRGYLGAPLFTNSRTRNETRAGPKLWCEATEVMGQDQERGGPIPRLVSNVLLVVPVELGNAEFQHSTLTEQEDEEIKSRRA